MWLINTSNLKLECFTPPKLPRYTILSHTWGDDEVGFQEFQNGVPETATGTLARQGLAKIQMTCQLAWERGIPYAWVDTCCIDKSSSAELSEAINSMFEWYRRSEVCFAFINDWEPGVEWEDLCSLVPAEPGTEKDVDMDPDAEPAVSEANPLRDRFYFDRKVGGFRYGPGRGRNFRGLTTPKAPEVSGGMDVRPLKWFTRGWTLQELIASSAAMEFYDASWGLRGVKNDIFVIEHLSRTTGISRRVLADGSEAELRRVPVGQRMSWAAYRETSRISRIVCWGSSRSICRCCTGRAAGAFKRLQEEIIKSSTDLSIIAWCQDGGGGDGDGDGDGDGESEYRGILAYHPREFQGLRECELVRSLLLNTEEITISNKGLRLHTLLFYPYDRDGGVTPEATDVQFMYLGCEIMRKRQGIFLKRMDDVYVRAEPQCWVGISEYMRRGEAHTIYLA